MSKKKMLSRVAEELVGQPMFGIMQRVIQMENEGYKITHFELGDPDFKAPENVISKVHNAMNNGMTHYAPSSGLPEFREAIKISCNQEFDLITKYEQVVVTPGANSGIYWVMRVLLNEGDEVLLPNPGFPSFFAAAKSTMARIKNYRLCEKNNFIPDIKEINELITDKTKLIVLNSPSNPIGSVIPTEILFKIYKLAEEKNIYILSDDVYRRVSFSNNYTPSVIDFDSCNRRTIMLGSLSKEYSLTGFRLGYLIGPPEIIKKIGIYIETVNSCVPPFIQMGGVEALLGNQENRNKNLKEIIKRRDVMTSGLNSLKNISCHISQGGLYVFPNISKTGLDCDEFFELILSKAKVACVPGNVFGEFGKNYVRFSLNVDVDIISKSIKQIEKSLKNYN